MLACPQCHNHVGFAIHALQPVTLVVGQWTDTTDHHTAGTLKIYEAIKRDEVIWNNASKCRCVSCTYEGLVQEFLQQDNL